jgi:hypothetical protein
MGKKKSRPTSSKGTPAKESASHQEPTHATSPALVTSRRRFSVRIATAILLLLLALVLTVVLTCRQHPAPLRMELTEVASLAFAYGGHRDEAYSPMCGCSSEKASEWWGISFAARNVLVEHQTTYPYTNFSITAAAPEHIRFMSEAALRVSATLILATAPKNASINLAALAHGNPPPGVTVLRRESIVTDFVTIITTGRLHVALRNATPLGAWLPRSHSTISVGTTHSLFTSKPSRAMLTEHYAPWPQQALDGTAKGLTRGMEYSLGDFLGPDVIFWTTERVPNLAAGSLAASGTHMAAFWESPPLASDRDVYTMVAVTAPTFVARLAIQPVTADQLKRTQQELTFHVIDTAGTIHLHLEDPPEDLPDIKQIYATVAKRGTVAMQNVPVSPALHGLPDPDQPAYVPELEFHYPPGPPRGGFNIFGPIARLQFTQAAGRIDSEQKRIDVSVPSVIELRDITTLSRDRGAINVPISVAANKATLALDATATLTVNGSRAAGRTQFFTLEMGLAILTIVSTVASVLQAWKAFRPTGPAS